MSKPKPVRRRPLWPLSAPRRPAASVRLTTTEGDDIAFASAHYEHTAPEEIRQAIRQADDFDMDDDWDQDGSLSISWYETRPKAGSPAPLGRRVLATLTLTATTLEVEAMSQQRLKDCRKRLRRLLGDRIRLVEAKTKSVGQALRERKPRAKPQEPFVPPPEVIAELEEKMLRQWIDESIPALGGLTPREAVKTPQGRRRVLELIDEAGRMQRMIKKTPGTFAPDYRKVKKMLGLE